MIRFFDDTVVYGSSKKKIYMHEMIIISFIKRNARLAFAAQSGAA